MFVVILTGLFTQRVTSFVSREETSRKNASYHGTCEILIAGAVILRRSMDWSTNDEGAKNVEKNDENDDASKDRRQRLSSTVDQKRRKNIFGPT